jgi:hypothetical protein
MTSEAEDVPPWSPAALRDLPASRATPRAHWLRARPARPGRSGDGINLRRDKLPKKGLNKAFASLLAEQVTLNGPSLEKAPRKATCATLGRQLAYGAQHGSILSATSAGPFVCVGLK